MDGDKRVRDEHYVISLCDEVLGLSARCHHTFDFLRGDPGKSGRCAMLPVDAYYEPLKLVIEYHEHQHTESVPFFDQRITVSGVDRGKQRAIYDQRRRDILPRHGIRFVELNCSEFPCNGRGRLERNRSEDVRILRTRLSEWISTGSSAFVEG